MGPSGSAVRAGGQPECAHTHERYQRRGRHLLERARTDGVGDTGGTCTKITSLRGGPPALVLSRQVRRLRHHGLALMREEEKAGDSRIGRANEHKCRRQPTSNLVKTQQRAGAADGDARDRHR